MIYFAGAKQKHDVRRIKQLVFSFSSQDGVVTIDGTLAFDDDIAELSHKISEQKIEFAIEDAAGIPFEIMKMAKKLILFMKNPDGEATT